MDTALVKRCAQCFRRIGHCLGKQQKYCDLDSPSRRLASNLWSSIPNTRSFAAVTSGQCLRQLPRNSGQNTFKAVKVTNSSSRSYLTSRSYLNSRSQRAICSEQCSYLCVHSKTRSDSFFWNQSVTIAPAHQRRLSSFWGNKNSVGLQRTFEGQPRARGITGSATATEDSEAYQHAIPFENIPRTGGLCSLPYVGPRFLFKPFSRYGVEGIGHVLSELHDLLGPIYCWRHRNEWMVQLERIEDVELFLLHEVGTPYRTPISITQVYNKRSKVQVATLSVLNGEAWKRIRTPLNTLMNRPRSIVHCLPFHEKVAVDFVEKMYELRTATATAQKELFFKFATESAGVLCFNKRLGFLSEETEKDPFRQKLLKCYKTNTRCVSEAMFGKRLMYLLYEDSFFKEYKEAKEFIMEFTKQCLQEAIEELDKKTREGTLDPDEPNFLMSLLSDKNLTHFEAFNILDTLMSAGSDSTACGLQLLFYALAVNPEQQERLALEVNGHLGRDGQLTADSLEKMQFLRATIKESLRLYFPVPAGIQRRIGSNTVMSGYQIPKGTLVSVNSMRLATGPDNYDQPHSFRPERWLRDEQGRQRTKDIHTLAYLPFGFGPRKCVGQRVALQELYVAAAKLVQKYRVGLRRDSPPLEIIFTPFAEPKRPLCFTFTPR